jgi:hypothetical protein
MNKQLPTNRRHVKTSLCLSHMWCLYMLVQYMYCSVWTPPWGSTTSTAQVYTLSKWNILNYILISHCLSLPLPPLGSQLYRHQLTIGRSITGPVLPFFPYPFPWSQHPPGVLFTPCCDGLFGSYDAVMRRWSQDWQTSHRSEVWTNGLPPCRWLLFMNTVTKNNCIQKESSKVIEVHWKQKTEWKNALRNKLKKILVAVSGDFFFSPAFFFMNLRSEDHNR